MENIVIKRIEKSIIKAQPLRNRFALGNKWAPVIDIVDDVGIAWGGSSSRISAGIDSISEILDIFFRELSSIVN